MTASATQARSVPLPTPTSAAAATAAEYAALLTMGRSLAPADWNAPTECTGWRVRDMLAHCAGAAEQGAKLALFGARFSQAVLRWVRAGRPGDSVDFWCAQQIAQRESWSNDAVQADLERWSRSAPAARQAIPALLRRMPIPPFAGLRPGADLGYLLDSISVRDIWLHRIDIARATGAALPGSSGEAEVVTQVMRDLDLSWTEPGVDVELTGRVPGRWRLGDDAQSSLSVDAVAFMRLLSGRSDECVFVGDQAAVPALRSARVVF